jgi:hypothetical protein
MYISPTAVVFFWQAPTDLSGAPITNFKFTVPSMVSEVLDPSYQSYSVSNLQVGVSFTPEIQSSSDNGETWGPAAYFPTFTPIAPPADPPASASAQVIATGSIEISWTPPVTLPEGNCYYIVESSSSNPSDPTIGFGSQDLSVTSCSLSEFNPDSTYTFNVSIINQVGRSPPAVTNSVNPRALLAALYASQQPAEEPAEQPAEQPAEEPPA